MVVCEVLDTQHHKIIQLHNSSVISNKVMHRIERDLNLENQRLEI